MASLTPTEVSFASSLLKMQCSLQKKWKDKEDTKNTHSPPHSAQGIPLHTLHAGTLGELCALLSYTP